MSIGSHIAAGLAPLTDLVYPPRCAVCGAGIARNGGLCAACWGQLAIPSEPACRSCSRPFHSSGEIGAMAVCAPCMASPPRHAGISAATLYNDISRQLVLSFKHGGKIGLAPMLAGLIAARLPPPPPQDQAPPLLVPVPLHRWRLWRRGYNQAALLAHELARRGAGELAVDLLERRRATPALGGLGRKARRKALKGAIAIRAGAEQRLAGRAVILVDDVLTSGATSEACVTALLKGRAASVRIACFARVLDEALDISVGGSEAGSVVASETPEAQRASGAT